MATVTDSQEPEPTLRRPHAGLLRRERRALLAAREEELRRLGGLMVEMYRQNDYRDDLLAEVCAEVVGIENRVEEIGEVLADRRQTPKCACGTAILRGSHYCPNCGGDLAELTAAAPGNALRSAFA